MAARVPIIVEITAARSVICNVVENADMMFSLLKQFLYQSSVNPPHLTDELELLKESTISTIIGRYKNKNISAM